MRIGKIVGLTLQHMLQAIQPGMTTAELDAIGADFLRKHGARSAPILAYKFPGYTCISINDEAAHGVPSQRVIQPGDLVNIDVSAELDGFWADTGASIPIPPVRAEVQRLCDFTKAALEAAISAARAGQPVNAIGRAVEPIAKRGGYKILEQLGGHGVGRSIHEMPQILNYYEKRLKDRFQKGMVVTLEPFLTTGTRHVNTDPDGWTLRTVDGSLVAQYEHTVVITEGRPLLVTAV